MPETKWGRKETIIWPPRKPIYSLGALFLSVIATGLFVYLRFTFGLTALEKYYLPLYLKTEITGSFRATGQYQLLFISDGKRSFAWRRTRTWKPASTPQRIRQTAAFEIVCRRDETRLALISIAGPSDLSEQASPYLSEAGWYTEAKASSPGLHCRSHSDLLRFCSSSLSLSRRTFAGAKK